MTAADRTFAEPEVSPTARLNIERAREALSRARPDAAAAALRSPRPADLSRLRETDQARAKIESRAGAFRDGLRAKLGLADFAGPYTPVAFPASSDHLTARAMCDAEICAPAAPPVPAFETLREPSAPPTPPRPRSGSDLPADVDAAEPIAAFRPREAATRIAGAEPAEIEPIESWLSGEPDPAARSQTKKKRRKLFGLF